jgi:hypothetical protein
LKIFVCQKIEKQMWKKMKNKHKHNKTMAQNNYSGNNMFKQGINTRVWGGRDSSNNAVFRQGWGSGREQSTRSNPLPQRATAPVLHQEPIPEPPAIIIDDFPALGGLSTKPKPVIAKSFSGIAKEAASIVKPEPVKKKPIIEETEQYNYTNNARSGRMRMTLAEYLERKEEGEKIDEDDVSICSEYSNNVIDGDSDDDNDEAF